MSRLMRDGTAKPVSRDQIVSMDQPGKVAIPARGQLNREN